MGYKTNFTTVYELGKPAQNIEPAEGASVTIAYEL